MWPRLGSDGNILDSDEAAQENLFRMEEPVQEQNVEQETLNQTESKVNDSPEQDRIRGQRQNTAAGNVNRNRSTNQRRGSPPQANRNFNRPPRGPGESRGSEASRPPRGPGESRGSEVSRPEEETGNRPAGAKKNRGRRRPIRKPGEYRNNDTGTGRPVERKD